MGNIIGIMRESSARKLPKQQRRDQLLAIAQTIIRTEGADALTLGHLAERAGVSKPIAYEHFKTRSGLLIALYEEIDQRHIDALKEAIDRAPRNLADIARIMSDACMACSVEFGLEWQAVSAALRGDGAMDAFHQKLLDRYVATYREALAPYSDLAGNELRRRCVAIVGATDAIARDMMLNRIDQAVAGATLADLIVSWLSPRSAEMRGARRR